KNMGFGSFLDGNQINHASTMFSDVLRIVPGLKVQPSGDGRTSVITDSRSSTTGCVNYFIDGMPWTTMTPGDIDDFVRPSEMVAVEVYHGSNTPAQYQVAGQSSCAVVVVWTEAKMSTLANRKDKKP
ncbi:MAG: Plug domain-containing protein, partial [Gemmatimonadaceae bacterium]